VRYHDEEWGRPKATDQEYFEKLCLEIFQAGLSWITILRKRAAFRHAFAGFVPAAVARFGPDDVTRLLADAGIVRNRKKVAATLHNARMFEAQFAAPGTFRSYLEGFQPAPGPAPTGRATLPTTAPAALALSRDLKRRGFVFVGPTTLYAFMQSVGLVNDHMAACAFRNVTAAA